MKHYVGLDVSLEETSVCVVDEAGDVVREVKVLSEGTAALTHLRASPRFAPNRD